MNHLRAGSIWADGGVINTVLAGVNAAMAAINVSVGHYGNATFSALVCVIICAIIARGETS